MSPSRSVLRGSTADLACSAPFHPLSHRARALNRPNEVTKAYTNIWRDHVPEYEFHTFQRGAYFSKEVIPNTLAVISLSEYRTVRRYVVDAKY